MPILTLTITQDLQEQLKLLSERKEILPELVAHHALLEGVSMLMRKLSETRLIKRHPKQNERNGALQAFIRENWLSMTDDQIGITMGYTTRTIGSYRVQMNLLRLRGRKRESKESINIKRDLKNARLDELLYKYWETKTDSEIAAMSEPAVSIRKVCQRRLQLKLNKYRKRREEKARNT